MTYHIINRAKNAVKTILQLILNVAVSAISLVRVLIYTRFRKTDTSICIDQKSRLAIVGNGPSLGCDLNLILDKVNDYNFMVVNDFALTELYEKVEPAYYFFLDDYYWCDEVDSTVENILSRKELFKTIKNKTIWNLNIIIPKSASRTLVFQREFGNNENINIRTYNSTPFEGFKKIEYLLYDYGLAAPRSQNVLVASLYYGILMNYKNIYLLGADHDWLSNIKVDKFNRVCLKATNYGQESQAEYSPWLTYNGTQYDMAEVLRDLSKMFSGYKAVQSYSIYRGTTIYNVTKDSFIDSFKRVPYEKK